MKKVWQCVLWISIVILVCCASILLYNKLSNNNRISDDPKYKNSTNGSNQELPENPYNFDELKKTNPDIYSWIKIDNTNINYPIVNPNGKPNDYYLRKDEYGKYNHYGSIYTENYNKTDWSDPVTLVYGHNIWTTTEKKLTMFFDLHKFEDKKFFNENRNIKIYAKNRLLTYEIYSAFEYDDTHIMGSFNFSDKEVFQNFIEETLDPRSLNRNVRKTRVTTDDRLIVLSTCIKNKDNMRYLVVGVLKKDEKTK